MSALLAEVIAHARNAFAPLAALPFSSWALVVAASLFVWPVLSLVWSLLRWVRDLLRPDSLARELTLRASDDGYIMLGQWNAPWIGGATDSDGLESKKTSLLVRCGNKNARGTVRYSQAKDMVDDVLGLPQDIADRFGLTLEPDPVKRRVSVRVARRFPIENLWNNADLSIKLSFRTAVWIAVITTLISLAAPALLDYV